MVASNTYFLFIILLATTVITILPSLNLLPVAISQDEGGDDEGGVGACYGGAR
jgi:hypothetical protein